MTNDNNIRELYRKYKTDRIVAERDQFRGVIMTIEKNVKNQEIIVGEKGREHIVDERGDGYIIFRDKAGRRYVSKKLSGDVPKRFFNKNQNNYD